MGKYFFWLRNEWVKKDSRFRNMFFALCDFKRNITDKNFLDFFEFYLLWTYLRICCQKSFKKLHLFSRKYWRVYIILMTNIWRNYCLHTKHFEMPLSKYHIVRQYLCIQFVKKLLHFHIFFKIWIDLSQTIKPMQRRRRELMRVAAGLFQKHWRTTFCSDFWGNSSPSFRITRHFRQVKNLYVWLKGPGTIGCRIGLSEAREETTLRTSN